MGRAPGGLSCFGLFSGEAAVVVSLIFLVTGLAVVSVTEPLKEEK